jgi:zeta-carotene desaturase
MKEIRALDNISFKDWFLGMGGSQASLDLMWDAIAYGLGFIDCENISARCMLTIFQFFASRTEASILRMLEGAPDEFLHKPIVKLIESKGGKFHLRRGVREVLFEGEGEDTRVTGLIIGKEDGEEIVNADVYICATDVPGVKRIIPEKWRAWSQFDNIYKLDAVPVITVQLRFDGWVTDIDNLLYAIKVDFSTFADLAITSPTDYYKEGEGSLLQLVITPADDYIKLSNEAIVEKMIAQVHQIFPSSNKLNVTWSSVVKLAQSLYREAPGKDPFRPTQATPVKNFFLAGSYTMQDYIDSMEGATLSGKMCAAEVIKGIRIAQ